MQEAVGSLKLQWQDRPEGAEAEYRRFLEVQRRRRSDLPLVRAVQTLPPETILPLAQRCSGGAA